MTTKQPEVSVVIPNYNGIELLKKNLPKVVSAKTNKRNRIKEIIIVDDASTDDSIKLLRTNFKNKIRLFQHKKNRGFASTSNLGVRMARAKLVCLLNTDVSPSNNFLERTIKHFKDPNVFGVSLHEKGYTSGPGRGVFQNGFIETPRTKSFKTTSDTFWVSGGSGVFSRKLWLKLKGFDEKLFYPYYWEDIDISYRALKRGYKLFWEPKSKVVHKHEETISKVSQPQQKNLTRDKHQLIFIWKNITSRGLFRKHLRGLIKRTSMHPGYIKIILMALKEWQTIRKKRAIERKESKVSDEAIFAQFN